MIPLKSLKITETWGVFGNAMYDHNTGEILMPPFWRPTPFYLVSIAHEVGHMLHHKDVGTEAYEVTPVREAERIAWEKGYEEAKELGIAEEYVKVWRNEIFPLGLRVRGVIRTVLREK